MSNKAWMMLGQVQSSSSFPRQKMHQVTVRITGAVPWHLRKNHINPEDNGHTP
jgi:hypothetical protein